jgi:hypothetical protein
LRVGKISNNIIINILDILMYCLILGNYAAGISNRFEMTN